MFSGGNGGSSSTVHGPRLPMHGKLSQSVAPPFCVALSKSDKFIALPIPACGAIQLPACRSIHSIGGDPRISKVDGNRQSGLSVREKQSGLSGRGMSGREKRWKSHVCIGPTESVGSASG